MQYRSIDECNIKLWRNVSIVSIMKRIKEFKSRAEMSHITFCHSKIKAWRQANIWILKHSHKFFLTLLLVVILLFFSKFYSNKFFQSYIKQLYSSTLPHYLTYAVYAMKQSIYWRRERKKYIRVHAPIWPICWSCIKIIQNIIHKHMQIYIYINYLYKHKYIL